MDRSTGILVVLAAYLVAMLAIGWTARRSAATADSYYLGGRTLGPWVAALAANASSSSAWSLLGVSGFAYLKGMAALWLLPGCIGGFLINWILVAPRLRAQTGSAVTLTELLAGPPGRSGRQAFVVFASVLTLLSLLTYVASQMQAAGAAFVHAFEVPLWQGVLVGAALTVVYTLLGGYLAASRTDMVQGLLMVGVAVVVPIVGIAAIGGIGELVAKVGAVDGAFGDLFAGKGGATAAAFALALCGIGLGYPGQPHAVNKFMGMSDKASMRTARLVGIGWALLLYPGMIVLGWLVRVQWPLAQGAHEDALFVASQNLLPPLVDGLVLAAVLAAIMSTVDGQLLVCSSCVTHDLGLDRRADGNLARATVLAIGAGATIAAMFVPKNLFDHVLFAWAALGSAFGPLLLVHLFRGPLSPTWALASAAKGGVTAILGYYVPVLSNGFADRVLSWVLALILALYGSARARRG
jgi:sodium/proline symporter